jgi:hypothetical protein
VTSPRRRRSRRRGRPLWLRHLQTSRLPQPATPNARAARPPRASWRRCPAAHQPGCRAVRGQRRRRLARSRPEQPCAPGPSSHPCPRSVWTESASLGICTAGGLWCDICRSPAGRIGNSVQRTDHPRVQEDLMHAAFLYVVAQRHVPDLPDNDSAATVGREIPSGRSSPRPARRKARSAGGRLRSIFSFEPSAALSARPSTPASGTSKWHR